MAREEQKLKPGRGSAFVKARLKRLPQDDETWEADFPALPRPMTQSLTHYLGMAVGGDVLTSPRLRLVRQVGRT